MAVNIVSLTVAAHAMHVFLGFRAKTCFVHKNLSLYHTFVVTKHEIYFEA